MAAQRTEQPTRRRIEEARKRGQVARSREVDSAVVLLAALGVLRFGGAAMWGGMESLLRDSFAQLNRNPLTMDVTTSVGTDLIGRSLLLLAPLLAAIAVLSLVTGMGQTGGPLFSTEAIKPQLKRMSLIGGAKRLVASKRSYVELLKSLLKFVVLGGVAALALRARWDELMSLGLRISLAESLGLLVDIAFSISWRVTIAVIVIAAADFLFQRYDLTGQLRMTRQELRDELRQSEGDPQVKAQMARLRRSFLARVMQSVPKADVVLVNPTHYAVALQYDAATATAPIVIAKGTGFMAQRIREVAEEHGIPVITNPPLTRAIYRAVGIGREITPDLYEAVAAILAFVYRLRTGRRANAA